MRNRSKQLIGIDTPIIRAVTLGLLAAAFFGPIACQRPAQPEGPTASALAEDEDLDILWDTSLKVLRKIDFLPDQQDRALGIITTHPTTTMQWHEPWRQDVDSGYALMEASMHTIQRKATVRFVKNGPWSMEVQVDMYRLSRPSTQITTASSVLHGFSGLLPTSESSAGATGGEHWVHLGRDGELEDRLLNRILNESGAAYVEAVDYESTETTTKETKTEG